MLKLKAKSFLRSNLLVHFKTSYSQYGQDLWIINEVFSGKKNGYFVEIGSTNGVTNNNTYLLETKYNWSGICIEPNPNTFRKLKHNRSASLLNLCIDGEDGEVEFTYNYDVGGIVSSDTDNKPSEDLKTVRIKARKLVDILKENNAPKTIDYLSIDVEGAEERILKDFPFSEYTILAITIERPTKLLHEVFLKNGFVFMKHIPGVDNYYMHESHLRSYLKNYSCIREDLITEYLAEHADYKVNL